MYVCMYVYVYNLGEFDYYIIIREMTSFEIASW